MSQFRFILLWWLLPLQIMAGTDTSRVYRVSLVLMQKDMADFEGCEKTLAEIERLQATAAPNVSYARALIFFSRVSLVTGHLARAQAVCRQGVAYTSRYGFKKEEGILRSNLGVAYLNLGKPDSAVVQLEHAGRLFFALNDKKLAASSQQNIGTILLTQKQYAGALAHFARAGHTFLSVGDSVSAAYADVNTAIVLKRTGYAQQAQALLQKAFRLGQTKNDGELQFAATSNLFDLLWEQNRFTEAMPHAKQMLVMANRLNSRPKKALAYLGISRMHRYNKNAAGEKSAMDSVLALGEQSLEKFRLRDMYLQAAEVYERDGDLARALHFYKKHLEALNETNNSEINRIVLETGARFENTRKSLVMAQQEKALANRKGWIILISGLVLVLLLLILLILVRHKKNLALVKKETELASARAMMRGEENERLRTSRELHDGIGAQLAGVKMRFGQLRKTMGTENSGPFDEALAQLDAAAADIRRVSHNLVPGLLLENGLDRAIEKYLAQAFAGHHTNLHYFNHAGPALNRLALHRELHLLRIIQELSNNALKHSAAANVHIQLNHHHNRLALSVEDDGKGFDPAGIKKGAGFIHLYDRVSSMSGHIEISAHPGKGTSVTITLPVVP